MQVELVKKIFRDNIIYNLGTAKVKKYLQLKIIQLK